MNSSNTSQPNYTFTASLCGHRFTGTARLYEDRIEDRLELGTRALLRQFTETHQDYSISEILRDHLIVWREL